MLFMSRTRLIGVGIVEIIEGLIAQPTVELVVHFFDPGRANEGHYSDWVWHTLTLFVQIIQKRKSN